MVYLRLGLAATLPIAIDISIIYNILILLCNFPLCTCCNGGALIRNYQGLNVPPTTPYFMCVGSVFRTDPVIMKKISQQQCWETSSQEETGGEAMRHLARHLVQVCVITVQLRALTSAGAFFALRA